MLLLHFALLSALVVPHAVSRPMAAKKEPHISGVVTNLRAAGASGNPDFVGSLLVEGQGQYDKASVTVNRRTRLYKLERGRKRPANFKDLKVGSNVQVWFTGPVAEAYPVQAAAREILLLKSQFAGRGRAK